MCGDGGWLRLVYVRMLVHCEEYYGKRQINIQLLWGYKVHKSLIGVHTAVRSNEVKDSPVLVQKAYNTCS